MGASAQVRAETDLSDVYGRLRRRVLQRARHWFPTLSEADLEDVYQSAWLSIVRTESEVAEPEKYLFEAVHSEGLMELRRRRRKPVESLEAEEPSVPAALVASDPSPYERAETAELSRLTEEILGELSAQQRAIVKLRWGWGLSREEIAGLLGVTPRAVKREVECLGARLREQGEVIASGGWCERRRSLVTAYAIGLLSARRERRAESHLRNCPGCRALVRELRGRAEDLAAVLPVPTLADVAHRHPSGRAGEVLEAARSYVHDGVASAKQQAVSGYVRTSDPTPLTAARPGAVAATVAGCLAVGGGTYCAVEGLPDPVRSAFEVGQRDETRKAPDTPSRTAGGQPDPEPVTAPAPPPVATPAPPQEEPPPAPAPDPAPPPPEFFGAPTTAPPAPVAQPSSDAGTGSAVPAPASQGGEFSGP